MYKNRNSALRIIFSKSRKYLRVPSAYQATLKYAKVGSVTSVYYLKQEGPGSSTLETGQNVTVSLSTPEAQFENKGQLNAYSTLTSTIAVFSL